MAVIASRASVGVTASRLAIGGNLPPGTRASCVIRNRGAAAVYLGGSDVTTSTGWQLDAGESFTVDLSVGDDLYAIVASSTVTCHVLQVGGS